jgi:hypothetical protein
MGNQQVRPEQGKLQRLSLYGSTLQAIGNGNGEYVKLNIEFFKERWWKNVNRKSNCSNDLDNKK